MTQFDGSHTGVAIGDKLLEIMKSYNIENRVKFVTSDSASNMIKGTAMSAPLILQHFRNRKFSSYNPSPFSLFGKMSLKF